MEIVRNVTPPQAAELPHHLGIVIGVLALTTMGALAENFNALLDGGSSTSARASRSAHPTANPPRCCDLKSAVRSSRSTASRGLFRPISSWPNQAPRPRSAWCSDTIVAATRPRTTGRSESHTAQDVS